MSDQKFDAMLAEWKTANTLSPTRLVEIRQIVLDTSVTEDAAWWIAQFGMLKGILKSSTACLTN